jgi:hypothetical protein
MSGHFEIQTYVKIPSWCLKKCVVSISVNCQIWFHVYVFVRMQQFVLGGIVSRFRDCKLAWNRAVFFPLGNPSPAGGNFGIIVTRKRCGRWSCDSSFSENRSRRCGHLRIPELLKKIFCNIQRVTWTRKGNSSLVNQWFTVVKSTQTFNYPVFCAILVRGIRP